MVAIVVGCMSDSESSEPPPDAFVYVGGEVVEDETRLQIVEADGTGERQLTPSSLTDPARTLCRGVNEGDYEEYGWSVYEPQWSSDGSHVLFRRDVKCDFPLCPVFSIWTIKADGTDPRRLTPASRSVDCDTTTYDEPVWSPDGGRIAYVERPSYKGRGDIYVMNADGAGKRQLTRRGDVSSPAWSTDGRQIAYIKRRRQIFHSEIRDFGDYIGDVYLMNADGAGGRRLTRRGDVWGAALSPDGRRIALLVILTGNRYKRDIFVLDLGDGDLRRLTRTGRASSAYWSPDGRRLAYSDFPVEDGADEVYVINADGTNRRNLSRHSAGDDCPVWSPDGRRIAFRSGRSAGDYYGIFVTTADGTGQPHRVATKEYSPAEGCDFDWFATG
jgi:Tol biopolymer transport system component